MSLNRKSDNYTKKKEKIGSCTEDLDEIGYDKLAFVSYCDCPKEQCCRRHHKIEK